MTPEEAEINRRSRVMAEAWRFFPMGPTRRMWSDDGMTDCTHDETKPTNPGSSYSVNGGPDRETGDCPGCGKEVRRNVGSDRWHPVDED